MGVLGLVLFHIVSRRQTKKSPHSHLLFVRRSFQEVMELTQRKFLRQLVMYRTSTGHAEFPHLVLIDLIDKDKQDQGQVNEENTAERCGESAGEEEKVKEKLVRLVCVKI